MMRKPSSIILLASALALATTWRGTGATLSAIGAEAERRRRPLRVDVYVSAVERRLVAPGKGWLLEGLVYAPTSDVAAGGVDLAPAPLERAKQSVPPSFLELLEPTVDPTAEIVQSLLRCTQIQSVGDPLLAGRCNGG